MKLKLSILILMLTVMCVPVVGAHNTVLYEPEVFSFNGFLPQVETSFENLDPRDRNNQPIKFNSAKMELRSIFISGLYNLLVYADVRSLAKSLSFLREKLNLAALAYKKHLSDAANNVVAALSPDSRHKRARILNCLSGFLAFKILIVFFLISTFQFLLSYRKIAPLNLRC